VAAAARPFASVQRADIGGRVGRGRIRPATADIRKTPAHRRAQGGVSGIAGIADPLTYQLHDDLDSGTLPSHPSN
jgi:hypothetical protein